MYVYVISAGEDRQKVGMAGNPVNRLNELRTGSPARLTLAHIEEVADARAVERRAHELLAACRVHGEWFDVSAASAVSLVKAAIYDLTNTDDVYSEALEWTLKVGDRVICRKGGHAWVVGPYPVEGETYTISKVYESGCVDVEEAPNDNVAFCPSMFWPPGRCA